MSGKFVGSTSLSADGARVREFYMLHDSADLSGSPARHAVAQREIMAESELPCNCGKQPASRLA